VALNSSSNPSLDRRSIDRSRDRSQERSRPTSKAVSVVVIVRVVWLVQQARCKRKHRASREARQGEDVVIRTSILVHVSAQCELVCVVCVCVCVVQSVVALAGWLLAFVLLPLCLAWQLDSNVL
jgi:TRAP-type uncharacterized transport system fused permease subunit